MGMLWSVVSALFCVQGTPPNESSRENDFVLDAAVAFEEFVMRGGDMHFVAHLIEYTFGVVEDVFAADAEEYRTIAWC
jgi:hypothetical protein